MGRERWIEEGRRVKRGGARTCEVGNSQALQVVEYAQIRRSLSGKCALERKPRMRLDDLLLAPPKVRASPHTEGSLKKLVV